jgi:hypothetical protein
MWLGLSAFCQTGAGVALFLLMLTDKEIAIRLNNRYSMGDKDCYFQVLLHFSTLVSFFLTFSCCLNIFRQIPRAWTIHQQKKTRKLL